MDFKILGTRIDPVDQLTLQKQLKQIIEANKKALVLNVNVNCLNLAYKQVWLREYLNAAELVFCDGSGVILGARLLGYRIPERITYANWMWDLAEFAEAHGITFFFLGARPGVAEKAAARLKDRFPNIKIESTMHGYFDKKLHGPDNEEVIKLINGAKPNILIVCFGMPLQERWLMENWDRIDANIALTGGAAFDYVSGELRRPHRWLTEHNLEWLGRLLIEPGRLWRRYIIGLPLFMFRIIKERLGLLHLDKG